MSSTEKTQRPVTWATVQRVAEAADRDEMEHLLAMTDEELDADLADAGFAPGDAAKIVQSALAKADAPTSKVIPLAAARPSSALRPASRAAWTGYLVPAAAALLLLAGARSGYVASREPPPAFPHDPDVAPDLPPEPDPSLLAAADERDAARAACAEHEFSECLRHLGAAAKLDPAGAKDPATQRMAARAGRALSYEAKTAPLEQRKLLPEEVAHLTAALAGAPHELRLEVARSGEAKAYAAQMAGALGKAGWKVTTVVRPKDAYPLHGVAVLVAAGSDEPTEAAAEALVAALWKSYVHADGPDDVPGRDAPITLRVGYK